MRNVYLDWAATSPIDLSGLRVLHDTAVEYYGNASSLHNPGNRAFNELERARVALARCFDCRPDELFFTSGATEANNIMVFSLLKRALTLKKDFSTYNMVVSAIEHASLWEPVQTLKRFGFKVKTVQPDEGGVIRPEALDKVLDKQTALVMVMLINNETGVIQPVEGLVQCVRDFSSRMGKNILFHSDIVQAACKIPFSLHGLGVDAAAISAHKFGGLKGIGALYLRKSRDTDVLYTGGGQEKGIRPGTENVAGIAGFAALAVRKRNELQKNLKQAEAVMNFLISELKHLPHARIFPEERGAAWEGRYSPYIIDMAFPPLPGEVAVRILNEHNIYVSTGSACHSHKKDRTRVLESMGIPRPLAECAIRVSLGPETTFEDISYFIATVGRELQKSEKG
jgi:cysteine desulfurase